jgi:Gpi18-like mannosyltransferase
LYLAPHTAFDGDVATWRDVAYQMVVKGRTFDFYHASIYAYPPVWSWFIAFAYSLHPTLNYHDEIFLILVKLPIIVSDVVIGVLIYLLVGRWLHNMKRGLLACALWLFNPHGINIGSMWGMNDSLCVVFIIASIYLLSRNRLLLSASTLGLAIATKQYAAFAVPFLTAVVLKECKYKKAIMFFAVPFMVLAIISVPYMIFDQKAYFEQILYGVAEQQVEIRRRSGMFWYVLSKLIGNYHAGYEFFMKNQYPIFFCVYAIFLAVFYFLHDNRINEKTLNNATLIPILVFLTFCPVVHAQYYVFLIPFAIMAIFFNQLKLLWLAGSLLPFYTFFTIELWIDRAECLLFQALTWLDNVIGSLVCDNLSTFKTAIFLVLLTLLVSVNIELAKED